MQTNFTEALTFLTITTFLMLVMGSFIVLILFLHKRKQEKNLQLLEDMKIGFENDLLRAQLEIQEQTFHDISRQIHDNINLSLTLAKLRLNDLGEKYSNELSQPIQIISEAINDLTDLSRSMNSEVIQECGLVTALSMEIKRIQKLHKIKFVFSISGNPVFLEAKTELYIFRILQETFNNILKHAKATIVHIDLLYKLQTLTINIKDNGCGFSPKHLRSSNLAFPSSGLRSIYKRIEYLKGKMEISSKPDNGTQLIFSLPILKSA